MPTIPHIPLSITTLPVRWKELREALAECPPSPQLDLVLAHLARSRFIVAVQLPMSASTRRTS
jgi:hypothetical protein